MEGEGVKKNRFDGDLKIGSQLFTVYGPGVKRKEKSWNTVKCITIADGIIY
jgi:hypothetical protein